MDTSEATQLLTWLDEEHRRDKAMVAELQKSIEQHEGHLSNVTERMEKLEERLAQTNAELARMSRFEQALQKFKDEILLELRGSEERLREQVDNKEKLLREERQERAKGLTKLAARVEEAFQFGDQLQTQQAELQRLNKAISALQLQIDEALKEGKKPQEKLLVLAERLKKSDEKLTELVEEGEEEKVRSEGIKEKLKVLEGWAERGTQQIVDLQTFGERLREEQAQSVEQLRTVDDRRAKRIAAWAREMGSWRKEAEKLREQPTIIEKWHRSAERTLAALDELKTQLQQDREVLEHLQHAGEERQKQQLEEWRKENEMLWLRNDERWQQLGVENAKRDTRVTQLWESQSEHLRRQVRELAKWIKEFEKRLVRSKK